MDALLLPSPMDLDDESIRHTSFLHQGFFRNGDHRTQGHAVESPRNDDDMVVLPPLLEIAPNRFDPAKIAAQAATQRAKEELWPQDATSSFAAESSGLRGSMHYSIQKNAVPASPMSQATLPCYNRRKAKPNQKRIRWTPEEDAILIHCVEKYGAKHWTLVATFLPGRTADNVRLRYMYFLRIPDEVREKPFSSEEDSLILREGNGPHQWKALAEQLGRSSNALRNRFDVLRRLCLRQQRREAKARSYSEKMRIQLDELDRH